MSKPVRVRFAPSPTGGLHLGGVRTALYNYLFARKHGGSFILRIEDTDRSRLVAGAETYILQCLEWCGISPDESTVHTGAYGPYRQSERKDMYMQYAQQLVEKGYAYYAFDTPEELELMRTQFKTTENPSPQYGHGTRAQMKNALTLDKSTIQKLLDAKTPYVIRIKMPENQTITFTDMIRGTVSFNTDQSDDKVLLKADGMPTYHLAVVVDDYLMKITHAFRGEEWLNSAPVHLLLWKYLEWENEMPQWAHLPLILGPDSAKLSKRHGNKYGFPIFAMNWKDAASGELTEGFRERGFLPEAFLNFLAMLGWSDGTPKELFTKEALVDAFSMQHVHKGGAQFDFEKAKWFNHEWIKMSSNEELVQKLLHFDPDHYKNQPVDYLQKVVGLIKDRCTLLTDFWQQGAFFFTTPGQLDTAAILSKWNEKNYNFFIYIKNSLQLLTDWTSSSIEALFKEKAAEQGVKIGELQLPFRIMLVGGKYGPGVFDIAALLGKKETIQRIENGLQIISSDNK